MAESLELLSEIAPEPQLGGGENTSNTDPSSSETNELQNNIRTKMLAKVALSNAHFKHQQRGEPDLTLEEKIEICQTLLDSSIVKFLEKFWSYLDLDDVEYFKPYKNLYEIDFYIKQIMKNKNTCFKKNRVKNRRYWALKELISKGEYFSEEEMKFREPFLYEQMVGQYLTQEEIQGKVDKSDLTFSSILLKHIDQLDENVRFGAEKDKQEGQVEEEEEEDDDDEMEVINEPDIEDEDMDGEKKKISDQQKQEMKEEFLTLMQEKFLNGEDKMFDYRKVDNNDAYDDLDILNSDAEAKYFDDDDM